MDSVGRSRAMTSTCGASNPVVRTETLTKYFVVCCLKVRGFDCCLGVCPKDSFWRRFDGCLKVREFDNCLMIGEVLR